MAAQSHENEVPAAPTSQVARMVEMQADENDVELFVERLFDELETVRDEMRLKVHALETVEARLGEREQQLNARSEELAQLRESFLRQEHQLAAAVVELSELRNDLTALKA